MGEQLDELNNSIRDNLPIASMGRSQNTYTSDTLVTTEYTYNSLLGICWKYTHHIVDYEHTHNINKWKYTYLVNY